jgi:putative ABC transport system permease protein
LTRSADRKKAFTVIGVVGDVRSTALNQESPTLYYPLASRVWPVMDVVVRSKVQPETLLPTIRQKVRETDSQLALTKVRTMDQWLGNGAAQPRLNTVLLSVFAAIALLIAAIGIYGVLSYSVNQRTSELGLRMALGATPRRILALVISEGITVVMIGILVGIVGALAMGRAVSSLVFGVTVRDPLTFAAVVVVLSAVALIASVAPARRASAVDPMIALRCE